MPIHRIPRADWDAEAVRLERSGERVTAVVENGPDHLWIYTIADARIELRVEGSPFTGGPS